jgi:hypothetical protein
MAKIVFIQDLVWSSGKCRGGHAMWILQWLQGLERLGHDILFLDYLCWDPRENGGEGLRRFQQIMTQWWKKNHYALVYLKTMESLCGVSIQEVARFAEKADAVITCVAPGGRDVPPFVERVRPRILIEQDPGYTHLWATRKDPLDIFGEHDIYYTVGGNIGTARCSLPTHDIRWRSIWDPVFLDWWSPEQRMTRDRFTTIAGWSGGGYLEFEGKILGPKREEFRKFIELPRLAGETLEIALDIEPDDPDLIALGEHGWTAEPAEIVGSPAQYRDYVQGSLGEFSVAKGGYVGTRSGWFSDRSECYLACGRPVVLQSTGFEDLLPTGEGLFAVCTVEEAAEAIRAIRRDYDRHARAARAIALEHFDSNKLLTRLLSEAGIRT